MENNGAVTTYDPDQIEEWLQDEDDIEEPKQTVTYNQYNQYNQYNNNSNRQHRHLNHKKKKKETGNPFLSQKCQDEAQKVLAECWELLENDKQRKQHHTEPTEQRKQIKVKPPQTPESSPGDDENYNERYIEDIMSITDDNDIYGQTQNKVINKDEVYEVYDNDHHKKQKVKPPQTPESVSSDNEQQRPTKVKPPQTPESISSDNNEPFIEDIISLTDNNDINVQTQCKVHVIDQDDDDKKQDESEENVYDDIMSKLFESESTKSTQYKPKSEAMDDHKSMDVTPETASNSTYSPDATQQESKLSAAAMPFVPIVPNPMEGIIVPMNKQNYESLIQQMYPNGMTINGINTLNAMNARNGTNGANTGSPINGITTTDLAVLQTLNYMKSNTYNTPYLYNTPSPKHNNPHNNNKHNVHYNNHQYGQNIGDIGDKLVDWIQFKVSPDRFVYNRNEYTLICGECDFSFTSSLIGKRGRRGNNICCTSWYYYTEQWFKAIPKQIGDKQFQSFLDNLKFCKHNGAKITFGVDAKKLKETKKKWDRFKVDGYDKIIFTFPEIYNPQKKGTFNKREYNKQNEMLMTEILTSTKNVLNEENGEIHIMLLKGQFYEWKVYKILKFLDLEISYYSELDKASLNAHFNSYIPRDGFANTMNIENCKIDFCSFKMKRPH